MAGLQRGFPVSSVVCACCAARSAAPRARSAKGGHGTQTLVTDSFPRVMRAASQARDVGRGAHRMFLRVGLVRKLSLGRGRVLMRGSRRVRGCRQIRVTHCATTCGTPCRCAARGSEAEAGLASTHAAVDGTWTGLCVAGAGIVVGGKLDEPLQARGALFSARYRKVPCLCARHKAMAVLDACFGLASRPFPRLLRGVAACDGTPG